MSLYRWLLLTLGPVLLVAASYAATPHRDASDSFDVWELAGGSDASTAVEADRGLSHPGDLRSACADRAKQLRDRLGPEFRLIVRPPYILAGDLEERHLDRLHREFVVPIERALSRDFFDHAPDEPVLLLVFATSDSFNRYSREFDGVVRDCYSGYYRREKRRVMVDLSSGSGTLAHELTHALAHFDFPEMPEWFDEGLAAVYEESEFTPDGRRLRGLPNWRIHYLRPAIERDQLPSVEAMFRRRTMRPDQMAIDYAQARYFCLYLQEQQLLEPFYRKFRQRVTSDPVGSATLRMLVAPQTLDELDSEFREWVAAN